MYTKQPTTLSHYWNMLYSFLKNVGSRLFIGFTYVFITLIVVAVITAMGFTIIYPAFWGWQQHIIHESDWYMVAGIFGALIMLTFWWGFWFGDLK